MTTPRVKIINPDMKISVINSRQSGSTKQQVFQTPIKRQSHTTTPSTSDNTLVDDTVALVDDTTALVGGATSSMPAMRSSAKTITPRFSV